MRKIVFYLFLSFTSLSTFSQTIVSISDGNVATCNGTLFDSGGQGAAGYSNNENFTLVICPDNPGDVITLIFNNFALDLTNTATAPANNADNIAIYDGNTTTAPSLGTYTGNQLQGTIVATTTANTSGCITLVFNSNSAGTGTFSATITCSTPCQPPTALFTSPTVAQNPQRICNGDSINFDASASTAQSTFNIVSYIFDYDDGTIDTLLTPFATHFFNNGPREYLVKLSVIDDNGCINLNSEVIAVWVSTTPNFNISVPDSVLCLGESICLDGSSIDPVTYTPTATSAISGATYLPDNVGQCFQTPLNFGFFNPGQTLNNINDLTSICLDMEHTFMGDMVISIICPNGTSVVLHQQGGGGTNLGNPIQADGPNLVGTGLNYCFSPIATNGTWVDNSTGGITPNTFTNNTGFQSLSPGTYESVNSLSPLVGCPLNGVWTLEICDLFGADDGFIFGFTVDFDPSIFPSLTTYTPSIGDDSDSTFWTQSPLAASFIDSIDLDSNVICITPTMIGSFDYTFNAFDDFGCFYDTTITITVEPGPQVNAGNDVTICGGAPVQLGATTSPPGIYNYSWTPSAGLNNTSFSSPTASPIVSTAYIVEAWAPGQQVCGSFDTVNVFIVPQSVDAGIDSVLAPVCAGSDSLDLFTFLGGTPDATGSWFENGVPTDSIFNPQANPSGTYTFTYFVPDGSCPDSATVTVTVNTDISVDAGNDITICQGSAAQLDAVPSPPGAYNYFWTPNTTLSDSSINNPIATNTTSTSYVVQMWETGQQLCSTYDTINVLLNPIIFAGTDNVIDSVCPGSDSFDLFTFLGVGAQTTGSWSNGIVGSNNIFDPTTPGVFNFTYLINDPICPDSATIQVTVLPIGDFSCGCPLNSSIDSIINVTCFNDCDGQIVVSDSLNLAAEYSLDGTTWQTDSTLIGLCAGTAKVFTQNTFYGPTCRDTVSFTVQGPPPVTIDVLTSINETCFGDCDGEININSPLAFFYSIDGGSSFQDSARFTNLCVGEYLIVAKDSSDCQADSIINVEGPIEVIADFDVSTNETFVPFTELTFTNRSQGATNYEWDIAQIDTFNTADLVYKFPDLAGDYQVCLSVTNNNGCASRICDLIIIKEELNVYIPNSFSPDGNNRNDVFKPVVIKDKVLEYSLSIYNRWGELIFFSNDPDLGWDGTNKKGDEILQTGIYTYQVFIKDTDFNNHKQTGSVTLIK